MTRHLFSVYHEQGLITGSRNAKTLVKIYVLMVVPNLSEETGTYNGYKTIGFCSKEEHMRELAMVAKSKVLLPKGRESARFTAVTPLHSSELNEHLLSR